MTTTIKTSRCDNCSHAMRPKSATLADYPNTKQRASERLCVPCHREAKKNGHDPLAFDLNAAAQALGHWLNERRRRGVPEDGYSAEKGGPKKMSASHA
jgi:hypothetical protein